ncbi:MAG: efflux RND transporter permease subunit [Candidatus Aminicenantes bacterium]|nr:efflux RND transporter permease subunit [Candidatus Aminicenantes bacterium]
MKLSRLAITNYQFTIILILLLTIMGVVSFLTMPRSEDPQVSPPGTSVIVIYPGTNPADMEQLVADPIEEKLNELDDIKRINAVCRDGIAAIGVEFHAGTDMDETYSQIVQKVNSIRQKLPEDIMELDITRWILSDHVIVFQLALTSETAPFSDLEDEAERLKKRLEKIFGVKKVRIWAVPEQEVRIALDLEKMSRNNIALSRVMAAIESSNMNIPGGSIDLGGKRFNLKTSGSFESLEDIRDLVIHAAGAKVVFLKDIADVRFDYEDNLYLARANGKRSVFVTINQKEKTNIFSVMEGVQKEVAAFQENLPSSIYLQTVFDQSESVAGRLNGFFSNLLQGLLLVGFVVLLAVGLRASAIVILAIPISTFISLGFVDLSGFGLQQMTIAGLVIALGLLVDNAIVVTENISRFLKKGYAPVEAAVQGTNQIGTAIISSTLTTVLAFFPIAMMGYTTGDYIRSMPITVIFTLTASLLIALTLTPYLSSLLLRVKEKAGFFRRLLDRLIAKHYRPTLNFALRRPAMVLAAAFAVLIASLFLFRFVGVSFFPKAEKPHIIININTPEGSNLETTDRAARFVESILEKKEEVKTYAANVGRGNPTIHYNIESSEGDICHAQLFVELKQYDINRTPVLIANLRGTFAAYPGARIEVKELEQGPPVEAPIAIKIMGDNMDTLRRLAADTENIFLNTPGTVNVFNPQKTSQTDLQVKINRAKAGMLGVPLAVIDRTIRIAVAGSPVSRYRNAEGKEYNIVVRLPYEKNGPSIEDFERIYVSSVTGAQIPLFQIAEVTFVSNPKRIDHYNFSRTVTLTADVLPGYSTDSVTKDIISAMDAASWPAGYRYYVSGELESRQESFGGMGRAVIIALVAIFAVLVLQFRSFLQPLIVFTAIPLAVIGSVLGLFLTGNTFSFTAFIGFTSLIGIVVNNSIILVDYTNKLKAAGKKTVEALKEAGETRFVPIILTTATTIGGLLPLTLRGGTMYAPMGWTIIGGLLVSTFLTLIVVPVLYRIFTPANNNHGKD